LFLISAARTSDDDQDQMNNNIADRFNRFYSTAGPLSVYINGVERSLGTNKLHDKFGGRMSAGGSMLPDGVSPSVDGTKPDSHPTLRPPDKGRKDAPWNYRAVLYRFFMRFERYKAANPDTNVTQLEFIDAYPVLYPNDQHDFKNKCFPQPVFSTEYIR
jgi:hypothetical protein